MNETDGIFMVKARRCKRCGGLLTRNDAIIDGYGHVCKMKVGAVRRTVEHMNEQMGIEDLNLYEQDSRLYRTSLEKLTGCEQSGED